MVLPCGATVGIDLCCYSVDARVQGVTLGVFQRYWKSVEHMDFSQGSKRGKVSFETMECFLLECMLCKAIISMNTVKLTLSKTDTGEERTFDLSPDRGFYWGFLCQGPPREQRPNSINVNLNPSDGVRNRVDLKEHYFFWEIGSIQLISIYGGNTFSLA